MKAERLYFPVDKADVFRPPPPPRKAPDWLANEARWWRPGERRRAEIFAGGELVEARVVFPLGPNGTELRYVEDERQMTAGGDLGVFNARGRLGRATVEYEFGGQVRRVRMAIGSDRPVPVRVGSRLCCGVFVHERWPGQPLLATLRLARTAL